MTVARGSTTELAERVADRAAATAGSTGKTLMDIIRAQSDEIASAIPPGTLDAGRFLRVVLTEVRRTPALQSCTQASFLGAMMQTAQLGLEPGTTLGHAFLIPYNTSFKQPDGSWGKRMECQLQIGYKGFVELGGRRGIMIEAREVKENDAFEFDQGTDPYLHHQWKLGNPRGELIGFYGTVTMPDGKRRFHVMDLDEIEERRKRSKVESDKGPWKTDYIAMCRKTVIRAMVPQIPMSPELHVANVADNAVIERGDDGLRYNYREAIDVQTGPASRADEVTEALNVMPSSDKLACSRYLLENFGPADDVPNDQIDTVLGIITRWPEAVQPVQTAPPPVDSLADVAATLPEPVATLLATIGTRAVLAEALGWLEDEYGPDHAAWDVDAVVLALDEWLGEDPGESGTTGAQTAVGAPDEAPPPSDPQDAPAAPQAHVPDELLDRIKKAVDTWDEEILNRVLREWDLPVTGAVRTRRVRLVTHIAPLVAADVPAAKALF